MKTLKDLNVTQLETSFLEKLIEGLYAEPGFTDIEIKDMAEKTGSSVESAKGVLGSLVKKGIVQTQSFDHSEMKRVGKKIKHVTVYFEFIILDPDYYFLHPNWR